MAKELDLEQIKDVAIFCNNRTSCIKCKLDGTYCGKTRNNWILDMIAEIERLRAELKEWNRIKQLFREERELQIGKAKSNNPYPRHGHIISGIWGNHSGVLSGHECAACAAAKAAMADMPVDPMRVLAERIYAIRVSCSFSEGVAQIQELLNATETTKE